MFQKTHVHPMGCCKNGESALLYGFYRHENSCSRPAWRSKFVPVGNFEAIFSMLFAFWFRRGEVGPKLNPNGAVRALLLTKYEDFAMVPTILLITHG